MTSKRKDIEGDAPATSASTSVPQPQQQPARRRVRQRPAGPPQLQFVTATDPAQFKDEKAKRSVRSQAMMQYRYQTSGQKRKPKDEAAPTVVSRSARAARGGKLPTRSISLIAPVPPSREHAYRTSEFAQDWQEGPRETIYNSTSEAWWNENPHALRLAQERGSATRQYGSVATAQSSLTPYSAYAALFNSSRYQQLRAAMAGNRRGKRVIVYEDSDAHEEELHRILLAAFTRPQRVGNGIDPFTVIPQFKHPELDAKFLVRRCNRAFSTKVTLKVWLPVMLADPHILLSSTLMAANWMDMHAGICAESKQTVLLKQECIGYIHERLSDSRAMEDSTLAIILHVLSGEMWNCNEQTMRIHQKGVVRLITQRGGMGKLGGGGAVAIVAADVTYHGNIICEQAPLPLFYHYEPPSLPVDDTMAVPESPLYCPRPQFVTCVQDPACSAITLELLCDMRDLTNLFINHHAAVDAVLYSETLPNDLPQEHPSDELVGKFNEIRAKVASLPSAHIPGLPTTHDWTYEACRLCAIIYASAIIMQVPLSAAAESHNNIILQDIIKLPGSYESTLKFVPRITETLYEVIERTNIGDNWNNMSGVFLWVTLVGAAAARTPVNIDVYRRPTCASEAYATWVRRCLIMLSTRCAILMIFEHPLHVVHTKKRLLRVQELLRRGLGDITRHGHVIS